ncbi:hypothetical protein JCM1840_005062 [Sporobolomyces johnsonii]
MSNLVLPPKPPHPSSLSQGTSSVLPRLPATDFAWADKPLTVGREMVRKGYILRNFPMDVEGAKLANEVSLEDLKASVYPYATGVGGWIMKIFAMRKEDDGFVYLSQDEVDTLKRHRLDILADHDGCYGLIFIKRVIGPGGAVRWRAVGYSSESWEATYPPRLTAVRDQLAAMGYTQEEINAHTASSSVSGIRGRVCSCHLYQPCRNGSSALLYADWDNLGDIVAVQTFSSNNRTPAASPHDCPAHPWMEYTWICGFGSYKNENFVAAAKRMAAELGLTGRILPAECPVKLQKSIGLEQKRTQREFASQWLEGRFASFPIPFLLTPSLQYKTLPVSDTDGYLILAGSGMSLISQAHLHLDPGFITADALLQQPHNLLTNQQRLKFDGRLHQLRLEEQINNLMAQMESLASDNTSMRDQLTQQPAPPPATILTDPPSQEINWKELDKLTELYSHKTQAVYTDSIQPNTRLSSRPSGSPVVPSTMPTLHSGRSPAQDAHTTAIPYTCIHQRSPEEDEEDEEDEEGQEWSEEDEEGQEWSEEGDSSDSSASEDECQPPQAKRRCTNATTGGGQSSDREGEKPAHDHLPHVDDVRGPGGVGEQRWEEAIEIGRVHGFAFTPTMRVKETGKPDDPNGSSWHYAPEPKKSGSGTGESFNPDGNATMNYVRNAGVQSTGAFIPDIHPYNTPFVRDTRKFGMSPAHLILVRPDFGARVSELADALLPATLESNIEILNGHRLMPTSGHRWNTANGKFVHQMYERTFEGISATPKSTGMGPVRVVTEKHRIKNDGVRSSEGYWDEEEMEITVKYIEQVSRPRRHSGPQCPGAY